MNPKCPRGHTLCLLLLATVAGPWLPSKGHGYDEFLQRHMDYPKSSFGDGDDAYCTEMMPRRGMPCWPSNTFLHASEGELQSLCRYRGHMLAELERSTVLFPITVCLRRRRKPHAPCSYKGVGLTKEIWVTCMKGLPVHLTKYG